MKRRILAILLFAMVALGLTACGYDSRGNEAIAQVKKVHNVTPMICHDFVTADLSLGVMRSGVGSVSTEDIEVTVQNEKQLETLKAAAESGKLVRFRYDVARQRLCEPLADLRVVEILDDSSPDSSASSR